MRQLKIGKSITNRDDRSLERYLQEIGREDLITAQDEIVLAKKIKQGDQIALEKLVKANLRFVVSAAKQYQNQGLSLTDLINEGNEGLIKAAKKFDETRGFKFISYAVWWIRQSILQALAEQARIVRLPLNQIGALNKMKKHNNALEQDLERPATIEELAKEMGCSSKKVSDLQFISKTKDSISIEAPLSDDNDSSLLDMLPSEENTFSSSRDKSLNVDIFRALKTLTTRESDIVRLFFGIEQDRSYTLEEIAERFDMTKERVRQIKEKAIRRLRHESRKKILRDYLED